MSSPRLLLLILCAFVLQPIVVSAQSDESKQSSGQLPAKNADQSEMKVIPLQYCPADALADRIRQTLGRSRGSEVRVTADSRTNSIIVQGGPQGIALVEKIVKELDQPAKSDRHADDRDIAHRQGAPSFAPVRVAIPLHAIRSHRRALPVRLGLLFGRRMPRLAGLVV